MQNETIIQFDGEGATVALATAQALTKYYDWLRAHTVHVLSINPIAAGQVTPDLRVLVGVTLLIIYIELEPIVHVTERASTAMPVATRRHFSLNQLN